MTTPDYALELCALSRSFALKRGLFRAPGEIKAVDNVSLRISKGETLGLVGESGCGKSTLAKMLLGLLAPTSGNVLVHGKEIDPGQRRARARQIQPIFQDPYSSLNPRMTIAQLVGEGLRLVPGMSRADQRARVAKMLREVGLQDKFADRYAHELSGGQRQRVAIARALIRHPSFVIADEPVSALDVTVRAQVLELFAELQDRHGFSCLFISHDLGVVEQVADRVIVMQAGRIIEQGSRDTVFDQPQQAYTRKLLSAIPALTPTATGGVQLQWRFDASDVPDTPDAPAGHEVAETAA